jgi:hypothetical protein
VDTIRHARAHLIRETNVGRFAKDAAADDDADEEEDGVGGN